jgi:arabinogalactan endo-1,4-beta-galactosidase
VLGDVEILQDSLYNYIHSTLASLAADSLLPEIVQIGNETNKGILLSQEVNDAGWILEWPRNSLLFNSAISAIRDIESVTSTSIKIALHIADPDDVSWYIQQFWDHGVQDFDIIGISYYWQFHEVLLEDVGSTITDLKATYPGKEVMIFETAYPWTTSNADGANNILYTSYPGYAPHSPGKQLQWMIDMTQEVIVHGGTGVVYWEPAWVSTGCWTQYGHGSNWENAAFFDFNDDLMEQGGIGWMAHQYDFSSSIKGPKDISEDIQVIQRDHEIIIRRKSDSVVNGRFEIGIYTLDGKKMLDDPNMPSWQNDEIHLTTPPFITGLYLFRLINEDHMSINKLLFLK